MNALFRRPTQQLDPKFRPDLWCITRYDLMVFDQEVRRMWAKGDLPNDDPAYPEDSFLDPDVGPNIYQVNKYYIKPRTLEADTSWALMRNPKGLQCDVFATHCWQEGVFEFTDKVRRMWPTDAGHLWCCFLSNPQNGDIGELLGEDPRESPFAVALHSAKYLLVVPNRRVSIYTRLWCVYEMHLARNTGIAIRLPTALGVCRTSEAVAPDMALFLVTALATYVLFFHHCQDHTDFLSSNYIAANDVFLGVIFVVFQLPAPLVTLFTSLTAHTPCPWMTRPMFLVFGFVFGFRAFWFEHTRLLRSLSVYDPYPDPTTMAPLPRLVCGNVNQVSLALTFLSYALQDRVADVLREEGNQLKHGTVRMATCSDESDERRLRRAIQGREDTIDSTIRTLIAAGKYNTIVESNLAKGLPARRLLHGVKVSAVVAGWTCWFASLLRVFLGDIENAELENRMWYGGLTLMTVSTLAVTWGAVRWIQEDAIFATDVLLWSGTTQYIVQSLFFFAKDFKKWPACFALRCTLLFLGVVVSFFACLFFYWPGTVEDTENRPPSSRFWTLRQYSEDSQEYDDEVNHRVSETDKAAQGRGPRGHLGGGAGIVDHASSSGSSSDRDSSDEDSTGGSHDQADDGRQRRACE